MIRRPIYFLPPSFRDDCASNQSSTSTEERLWHQGTQDTVAKVTCSHLHKTTCGWERPFTIPARQTLGAARVKIASRLVDGCFCLENIYAQRHTTLQSACSGFKRRLQNAPDSSDRCAFHFRCRYRSCAKAARLNSKSRPQILVLASLNTRMSAMHSGGRFHMCATSLCIIKTNSSVSLYGVVVVAKDRLGSESSHSLFL